ncbi:MAG TPA: Dyp-type peroxidase [Jatrophihabitans sp.]|nr:Dyp-type peroxidase [Jatrophihabitans sp.]
MPPVPQLGITSHPPQHLLVAALAFANPTDTTTNQTLLSRLRDILRRELAGDLEEITAATPKDTPTGETGEVGVADGWEQQNLTVDVGFSAHGYAALGYTANMPADLIEVPWSRLGPHVPANPTSGDLVLHIRADNIFAVEHVLRRVEHSLAAGITTVWTLAGAQRFAPEHSNLRDEGRALIGFHDGLSNLQPDCAADQSLIFVDPSAVPSYPPNPVPVPAPGSPGYTGQTPAPTDPTFPTDLRTPPTAEPQWTLGGSYMFVRGSILDMPSWDSQPLQAQEAAIGRFKSSGAFLDQEDTSANKNNPPVFATQPASTTVPPTSHVRRSNPRATSTDAQRRILRRGYPLIQAGAGTIKRGLTFISFSRSLTTQIEFMLAAWLANPNFPQPNAGPDPLLAFETDILAGGYYFVPALSDATDATSWILPS